jgi:hypothetical protein
MDFTLNREDRLARDNYSYQKRQRELAKKKKKEAKLLAKQEKKKKRAAGEAEPDPGEKEPSE